MIIGPQKRRKSENSIHPRNCSIHHRACYCSSVDLAAMSVQLEERPELDIVLKNEEPIHSHIVDRGDSEMSAEALILTARVTGTPVTALCGYVWVPSRDPSKYPVCPKCLEIFEFARDFRGV